MTISTPIKDLSVPSRFGRLRRSPRFTPACVCLCFFAFAFGLFAFRLQQAPDLFADEGLYASIGNNLAAGRGLTENTGITFVWHPPGFPLIEAGYLSVFGLVDAGPVQQIYGLRYINATTGALTAALLFLIGWQMRGLVCGAMIALLYCQDSYVQRINRRTMLETTAALLLTLGVYLFLRAMPERRRGMLRMVGVGVAFGLAMLTKEFMVLGVLALLIFALVFRRDLVSRVLVAGTVTLGVYGLYPAWLFASGNGQYYLSMKEQQIVRLLGRLVVQPTDPAGSQPLVGGSGVSLWESMTVTIAPYLFSYLILGAAAGLMAWIVARALLRRQRIPDDRVGLMLCWCGTLYVCIGVNMVFGKGSDQFFYYLMVPATVIVGLALSPIAEQLWARLRHRQHRAPAPATDILARVSKLRWALVPIVLVGMAWNIVIYTNLFVIGEDDSYADLTAYMHQHIPPGTTIIAGSEVANYLFPEYRVRFDREPENIAQQKARYIILSSKDRWGGYNKVSHTFYDWAATNGDVRFQQYGPSFWDLQLFELKTTP